MTLRFSEEQVKRGGRSGRVNAEEVEVGRFILFCTLAHSSIVGRHAFREKFPQLISEEKSIRLCGTPGGYHQDGLLYTKEQYDEMQKRQQGAQWKTYNIAADLPLLYEMSGLLTEILEATKIEEVLDPPEIEVVRDLRDATENLVHAIMDKIPSATLNPSRGTGNGHGEKGIQR